MIIVGIDPGLTGAVARMGTSGLSVSIHDTPSFVINGRRRDYDVPGMIAMLNRGYISDDGSVHVFIERQQSRPEAGVASTFKIGYGYGLWMGIVAAWGWKCTVVSPQVWQKEMYQGAVGEGKERSLLIASRLWPGIVIPKSRHDRADALLIAEYGRRVLSGRAENWEEIT